MKITVRLVLLFGISIGFIYMIFSSYVAGSYTEILKKEVRESTDRIAEETSMRIANYQQNIGELLEGAAIHFSENDLEKTGAEQALAKIVSNKELNIVGAAFAYDPNIRCESPYCRQENGSLHFTDLAQEYDYWDKEWYTHVNEEKPVYWSRPYIDFGIPMITSSQRVHFPDQTFKGVLTVDISLAAMSGLLKKLGNEKAFVFILHEKSDIIISSAGYEGAMLHSDSAYIRAIDALWKQLPKDAGAQLQKEHYRDKINNKNYYVVFSYLSGTGWTAGALFEKEKVFAEVNEVINKSRWALLGGFALMALIIVLLARSITKPLRQLTNLARQIGEGNLNVEFPMNTEGKSEIAILSKTLQEMQNNLIRQIRLRETAISQKQKIESELQIAHEMQQTMLPSSELPDKTHFDIYACLKPAREVGGDLYDFFMLDEKRLCLVVGDVAGEGMPAALYMAITNTYIKAFAKEGDFSPASILTHTNTRLNENNETCMFVTLFCCVIDIADGSCRYANAGHNPPFIVAPSGEIVKIEQEPQSALGAFDRIVYREYSLKIAPGEILVLYTDGITEAMNASKEEFGESRLTETLARAEKENCKEVGIQIMENVKAFTGSEPPSDDKTLLLFKLKTNNTNTK